MTFQESKTIWQNLAPALALESVFPHRLRAGIQKVFGFLSVMFLLVIIVWNLSGFVPALSKTLVSLESKLPFGPAQINGMFYLFLFAWIILSVLNAFYYSFYSRASVRELNGGLPSAGFEPSYLLYRLNPSDITASFLGEKWVGYAMARAGIFSADIKTFLASRKNRLTGETFQICQAGNCRTIGLDTLALDIWAQDKEFADFLMSREIGQKEIAGVFKWVLRSLAETVAEEKWWSKAKLLRIGGIGEDWAYGGIYRLEKYGRYLGSDPVFYETDFAATLGTKPVEELESALSKSRGANAFVVGAGGAPQMSVIATLGKKIFDGACPPELSGKKIFIFDGAAFVAAMKTKSAFEPEFLKALNEGTKAGNVILVIKNFWTFAESASAIGSDVVSLLLPFIASPNLQIVATVETGEFHNFIEKDDRLSKQFEKILCEEESGDSFLILVEDEAQKAEAKYKIFFTFKAIETIVDSAGRYFSGASAGDKASDLVLEMAPYAKKYGKTVVEKEDVLNLVELKTGVPAGKVGGSEKDKLLKLEEVLHHRVIGQDEAVKLISGAMRRARSGVGNPNRPMGSFLFIGPTGVGKTETTKALAEAFFGNENLVMRLDMSEYRTPDALSRLIGSFESGKTGTLSAMLREKQYGVLLLDEFEKTGKEVLDLFLQILDEGFFSDAGGKRVMARNLIIIATSNAGSEMIFDLVNRGADLAQSKSAIIESIIEQGIFKPELLNRFDGVVLFHPLDEEALKKVAYLMLQKLQKRLLDKGVNFVIGDFLVDYLVKIGMDPKFGARPMNRAVQDKVEQAIADKMIKGEIRAGSTVQFTEADLS